MGLFKKIDNIGKSINRIFDKRKGLTIASLFLIFMIFYTFNNNTFFIYNDAKSYYNFSQFFIKDGRFAFSNYDNDLRGYIWPLLLLPIRIIAETLGRNPATVFRLIFAFFSAGFFSILIPNGVERIFKIKINFIQRLFYVSMVLFFWAPMFLQPLSDMPAYMFNIMGIFLIYYASSEKKVFLKYLYIILSGMLLAGTSLLRPVYQFSLYIAILLLIILNLKKGSRKNIILVVPLIIGAAIIFTPQMIINMKNFGFFSPYAQAQTNLDGRLLNQMGLGIVSTGSFGYIGEQEIALRTINKTTLELVDVMVKGPKQCFIPNTHGLMLLEKIGGTHFKSYGEYIYYVIRYPFDFIAVWMTHLFYELDLNFPRVFNLSFKKAGVLYSFLNYTVLFFSLWVLKTKGWFKENWVSKTIGLIILVIPCMVALMVNMEERFMLPLHMVIYMLLAFNPNIKRIFSKKTKFNFGMVLIYILFIILCFTVSASLMSGIGFIMH